MSRKERIVLYILLLIVIAATTFLIVITLAGRGLRIWPIALSISLVVSWFAVCARTALLWRLRQRRKRLRGEATTDEREKMIKDNASLASAIAAVFMYWGAGLILLLVCRYQGKEVITIKVEWLLWMFVASAAVVSAVPVITIHILRGRGRKHGQN